MRKTFSPRVKISLTQKKDKLRKSLINSNGTTSVSIKKEKNIKSEMKLDEKTILADQRNEAFLEIKSVKSGEMS